MAYLPGVSREILRAATTAPFLGRDEERSLARAWRERNDQSALHRLTGAHMRLVLALAARFRHYGLAPSDLVQEGHIGLLEAAARFEPDREVRFSTYATWWIRASLQDYVLRNWSIVRGGTSSAQKALFFNLRRLRSRLAQAGQGQAPTQALQSIADRLGVSRADVEVMDARLSGGDASLNVQIADSEAGNASERIDFLVDQGPLPDEIVAERVDGDRRARWLRDALAALNERELRILRERRLSETLVTLETLGDELGISKERVRQIENKALGKLRRALAQHGEDEEVAH